MGPTEYLKVLRSRWWAVAALMLIGAGVAWATTPSQSAAADVGRFRATTTLVKGPSSPGDPAATNLTLVASLVSSSVVIERSAAELGRPTIELATDLQVLVVDTASTLQISSYDSDPVRAVNEADTIAAQLIIFLGERRQQQLDPLIAATNERIATYENRIRALESQIALPGSAQADLQRAERDSMVRQLGANYDRLQQLTIQAASASNEFVVLSPAAAVRESTTSGWSAPDSRGARAAIALVVGLIAGLALVFAFERIDPKVRTAAQAELAFGLPLIAEIPRQSRRSRRRDPIAMFSDPYSVVAESYRGLRTALIYMPRAGEPDFDGVARFRSGHVVLVTSPEPGDGKTTVLANLAAGFAEKEADVVVVSGDARQPAIEKLLLGRRGARARVASSAISDTVVTTIPGVRLVPACDPSTTNPADIVDYARVAARTERARSQTVFIDTPPALVANDATELMHTADSIVLVARCGSTTVASARRTADLVARQQVAVLGVVLIGTDGTDAGDSSYYRKRPRRRTAETQRRPKATALRGQPAPASTPPPPRVDADETRIAEPVEPRAIAPVVDDGGIWRPKTSVIDLSGAETPPPAREPQAAPPRRSRAIARDASPSRDTLASSDSDLMRFEEKRKAQHESDGRRERLPLFRAGDHGNGNGHSR